MDSTIKGSSGSAMPLSEWRSPMISGQSMRDAPSALESLLR
jgi:hypothetical protein